MIKKDWVSDRETELLKEAGAFLGEPFQNKIERERVYLMFLKKLSCWGHKHIAGNHRQTTVLQNPLQLVTSKEETLPHNCVVLYSASTHGT